MFSTRAGRSEKIPLPLFKNLYKAKRLWPPDFQKIDQRHQFRLERKFRRRSKLKYQNPNWIKTVTALRFVSVTFIAVYGVFFMDWNDVGNPEHRPFAWARDCANRFTGDLFNPEKIRRQDNSDKLPATANVDR